MHELAVLYKEQARYDEAEKLLLEAIKGRRLKIGVTHPHTKESLNNLIALYEAWNKPEKAKEWRAKLLETEAENKKGK
jgi:tetratricopeptide (TPR) repeat protein